MSKTDVTIYLLKFALETLEANDLENTRNKDNWVIGRDIETHLEDLANVVKAEEEQCNLPVVSITEGELCEICNQNEAKVIYKTCYKCEEYIINGEHN